MVINCKQTIVSGDFQFTQNFLISGPCLPRCGAIYLAPKAPLCVGQMRLGRQPKWRQHQRTGDRRDRERQVQRNSLYSVSCGPVFSSLMQQCASTEYKTLLRVTLCRVNKPGLLPFLHLTMPLISRYSQGPGRTWIHLVPLSVFVLKKYSC
jgi:hypothetical protein